jgi:hypothetical protein
MDYFFPKEERDYSDINEESKLIIDDYNKIPLLQNVPRKDILHFIINSHGSFGGYYFNTPISRAYLNDDKVPEYNHGFRLFTYANLGELLNDDTYQDMNCPLLENTICNRWGKIFGYNYKNVREVYTGKFPYINIDLRNKNNTGVWKNWYPSLFCCETNKKYPLSSVYATEESDSDSESGSGSGSSSGWDNNTVGLQTLYEFIAAKVDREYKRPMVIQIFLYTCLAPPGSDDYTHPTTSVHYSSWPSYNNMDILKRMNSTDTWHDQHFGKKSKVSSEIRGHLSEISYLKSLI